MPKNEIKTLEQAKAIQEAFGPCTSAYECLTPEEILQHGQEALARSASTDHIRIMLDVESISAERMGRECYLEWKAERPNVVARLRALGFEVE